jgi:fermentation-respiration switch protein FrsA (DUF1100 family)
MSSTSDGANGPATRNSSCRWLAPLWQFLRVGVITYLLIVVVLVLAENRLVYLAPGCPPGEWEPPSAEFEDVYFRSADDTRLHGWYAQHAKPRAHLLYCHGSGDNVAHLGKLLEYLRDRVHVTVFAFDYRGYGQSEGNPTEQGVLADARAARAWLARRAGIDERDVVLLGRSLGGGVAVDLAAELPPRGLVLESTFTSLPDVAAVQYPWVPVRLLMKNHLDSLAKIGRYHGPLLQSHGDADEIIPFEQAQRLFEAAPGRKQFIRIRAARHNDPQTRAYYRTLARFLDGLDQPQTLAAVHRAAAARALGDP